MHTIDAEQLSALSKFGVQIEDMETAYTIGSPSAWEQEGYPEISQWPFFLGEDELQILNEDKEVLVKYEEDHEEFAQNVLDALVELYKEQNA